jgi:hypothetical protein
MVVLEIRLDVPMSVEQKLEEFKNYFGITRNEAVDVILKYELNNWNGEQNDIR